MGLLWFFADLQKQEQTPAQIFFFILHT